MNRLSFALILAALTSAGALASFNLDLDENYKSTLLPNTGSVVLTFSGKVDVFLPSFDVNAGLVEVPGLTPSSDFLAAAFTPAFVSYMSGISPGADYIGDIFTVTVNSTDAAGEYFYNSTLDSPLAEIKIGATNGLVAFTDAEGFGVTVNAVPEPASMAVLGLGAAALLRRRTRR